MLPHPFHQPRILTQRTAGFHQRLVLPVIDVQHRHLNFNVAPAAEGIAQFQHLPFRLLCCAIIKTEAVGLRQRLQPAAIPGILAGRNVIIIQPAAVREKTHGHVRIETALVLPQIHFVQDDERHIVLHLHVHRVINSVEPDVIRILVIGTVNAVVQRQRPFLVGRISKNKLENPVFVLRINPFFINSFH